MKAAFLHNQHARCLKALVMIANCDGYIRRCKENLRGHYKLPWVNQIPGTAEFNEKNIAKYRAIKSRLITYYQNQFMKMVDAVVEAAEL